ncbi:hypothetical protein ACFYXM_33065 [Streptomyces sp. NPDC002476]|uniref:hypothetical protein n=1 Tax=Streptomyces sp. NPDC002476 TaxID=3364648 RepID=UPI00368B8BF2
MWAALVAVAGHVPVPLAGNDYLELLPVRWQAVTEHGIRLHHRTYDHDLLTEIPWIHREHAHEPFNDRDWQYLRTATAYLAGADAERAGAGLADALSVSQPPLPRSRPHPGDRYAAWRNASPTTPRSSRCGAWRSTP